MQALEKEKRKERKEKEELEVRRSDAVEHRIAKTTNNVLQLSLQHRAMLRVFCVAMLLRLHACALLFSVCIAYLSLV